MEIIDCHAHIYPEKIAAKAVSGISDFYSIKMTGCGTAENLIADGKKAGITGYLVHSVATSPKHVETINNFIAEECKKYSFFHGFGTSHQDHPDKVGEAEKARALGLKGIKLHPDTQGFDIDDERMLELYAYMQDAGMILLLHTGDYRYDHSHPSRVKKILREFPRLKVIAAHFGGWSIPDLALEYLENESCYVDTSSSIMYTGKKRAAELIRKYGSERVLFGSDFPMWSPAKELETVMSLGLRDNELENILFKNAEELLNRSR